MTLAIQSPGGFQPQVAAGQNRTGGDFAANGKFEGANCAGLPDAQT
jgi:hypothetical protein